MKRLSVFNLAKENIKRRIFRNLVIVLAVGFAVGTLFSASILLRGVETGIRDGANGLGADLIVMPQSVQIDAKALLTGTSEKILVGGGETGVLTDIGLMPELAKVAGVQKVTPQLYLATWDDGEACCRLANLQIMGFDPASDFTVQRLVENRFELKMPFPHDEIFLGYHLTPEMGDYEVLRVWKVYGYNFKVIGRLKKTGTALDWSMFIPLDGVYTMTGTALQNAGAAQAERIGKITQGKISSFLVKVDPMAVTPKDVIVDIKRAIPGMTVISTADMVTGLQRQLYGSIKALIYSGLIIWVMAILVVGTIFSAVVNERKREIGLLRAMGFKRSSVFQLVLYESTALAGLGGVLGLLLGGVLILSLSAYFQTAAAMPFTWPGYPFTGAVILASLIGGLALGLLGALYPAAKSSLMEPLLAIRTGE